MGDYGHDLEFGVFITPEAGSAEEVVALSAAAEVAGYDLVSFQDHPYQPRFLDTWTLLSFVAARTSRVRLAANVLNLPLRPPAVLARAAASLDILSGGRVELGLGAGAFWDAIEAMGGPRLTPGESVAALEEAIQVIRALWAEDPRAEASFAGKHYRLAGSHPGPAPEHQIGIWVGAYKPRMLRLVGRRADGWLPSLPYLKPGDLGRGNAVIDAAAAGAGREPKQIRRLLNLAPGRAPAREKAEELAQLAIADGIATFIVMADDARASAAFASEVAPRVRELVAEARSRAAQSQAVGGHSPSPMAASENGFSAAADETEAEGLGVTPTPDPGTRLSDRSAWDEATRPHRRRSGPAAGYTEQGRAVGQHLIEVHDMLRRELSELRDILQQVRDGAIRAGAARAALNQMALRQNDWTLGAFCSRYCSVVTQHHGLEDAAVFPHLATSEPELAPVIDRLAQEHLVIHDAIQAVDQALVSQMTQSANHEGIQAAIDYLTDALLSHLSYEEQELVEPLARLGFYPDQVPARG